ncbi:MAG: hypothetical protein NT045_02205, partial [Candidatus Aureabacteria bacterium]|nr:hypothetical protein [Candidatus Auribacterota bacterium]
MDSKMRGDLLALDTDRQRRLRDRIHRLSLARGITYQKRGGVEEAMRLVPIPAALPEKQVRYLSRLCMEIIGIVKRIVPLYLQNPAIRRALPLLPEEDAWLRESWRHTHGRGQPIVYRLDADVPLAAPDAARRTMFFENNSVAVGGMVYAPVAESIMADATFRALYGRSPETPFTPNEDTRLIILGKIAAHARLLGRRGLTVALVEDKSWDVGITEMPSLARFFRKRGVTTYLVDPRELTLRRGEVRYRGRVVDVLYRNAELRDFLEIERSGKRLAALRAAFMRNQVVSSLSGEFDHKSLWEVFGSEEFAPLFTASQRRFLRLHIPWTRLISERHTAGPHGRRVDLPEYVRTHRTTLVMKPNRHCGGEGVAIGLEQSQAVWDKLIARALREDREWVVQEWIDNTMKLLPWWEGRRGYRPVPMY